MPRPAYGLPMRLCLAHRSLDLTGPPALMGIVNVTPDSFYDRGLTSTAEAAVTRAGAMLAGGAAIVDIGGMTARPGMELAAAEEIGRVDPVVRAVRDRYPDCLISVDTYRAEVAVAALAAGADLINDHTGLSDGDLAAAVAERRGGLVITHLGLRPKQAQEHRYTTTPAAIAAFLDERAARAESAGVDGRALLVDPGLGFGKTTETDLETLRCLPDLLALGRPVLLACSHKEVTAEPLGLPEESVEGTAAVVAVAAHLGVHVLRVHDLPFMERVARMGWLISGRPRGEPTAERR